MEQPLRDWNLFFCAGYLVPPCKNLDTVDPTSQVRGSAVELSHELKQFFLPLFTEAETKYPIDIVFSPREDGTSQNPVRDLIRCIAYENQMSKVEAARGLALRLAAVSDQRSPIGLLIVLAGVYDTFCRIALWKFPADESLQASFSDRGLNIQLIEDAFSKKGNYFKAALFEGTPADSSFWGGKIEDRQARERVGESSELWMADFLDALPNLKGPRGSKLLARALKKTIERVESVETQEQLTAAAITIKTQSNRNISFRQFADDYLPEEARELFLQNTSGLATIQDHSFRLDTNELDRQLGLKSLVLDNSFIITGPLEEFNQVVTTIEEEDRIDVTLKGHITRKTIKSRR